MSSFQAFMNIHIAQRCLDAADLGDYKKPFLLFGLTFIKKSGSQG